MTITQVQYVCEIARRGSLTRAAEHFYLSQPALSEQIRSLENELGCTLFRRTSRGMVLTEAGERFCRYAEPAVEAWRKLEQNSAELKNSQYETLRIGFGLRARSNGLFEPLMTFFDGHPNVSFSFYTDMKENFAEAIESRDLDVAICRLYGEQSGQDSERIAVLPMCTERQCILTSEKDPLSAAESLPITVLAGKTVICGPAGSGDDLEMKSLCEGSGVSVARVLRADDINAVMSMVQRGKGYALGPVSFSNYFGVAAIPLEPEMQVALNLLCRKEDRNTPMIRQLRRSLENSLQQNGAGQRTERGKPGEQA